MPQRTKTYLQINWNGGMNTAVEPGILPDTDLVQAENIIFDVTRSRKKRQNFAYFDSDIPKPNFRLSSGTTRTLKWTTSSLQELVPQDDKLVNGEKITITSTGSGNDTSYAAEAVTIASLTNTAEVTDVQCVADVSGSLNNKYFYLNAAEDTILYYVWFNVSGGGTDPAISGRTGIEVAISTNDGANTVASAVQTAVDAETDFGASVSTDTVTVTNASSGIATDASDAGSTGFTITVTTDGGHSITYTATTSLTESETATTTLSINREYKLLNLLDYWRFSSNTKSQLIMAASNEFKLYRFDTNGNRQEVSGSGGPSGTVSRINSIVFNDKAIFCFDAVNDKPIKYDPDSSASYAALGGTPPDCTFMVSYLGRLWCDDKTNPDRLHYSSTGNGEEWNGEGDSGAIDISVEDGDSAGISGAFVYNGSFWVGKRDSLFRIFGDTPETFKVEDVTKGIGIENHASIAYVDQQDVIYMSSRGFHAASSTEKFGDIESQFISAKIQPTFNNFQENRLKFVQGKYVSDINSVAFSASEGSASQNQMYLYNVNFDEWYKWPEVSCESLESVKRSDRKKLFFGNNKGRVSETQSGSYTDYSTDGIVYKLKSGTIYPGNNPQTWKKFHRITMFLRPVAQAVFTVNVKVDNYATQSFLFQLGSGADLLGTTFVLGTSTLASSGVFGPFSKDLHGHGRGCTIEVIQSGTDEQVDIYGFSIEFEEEGTVPEVIS